MALKRITEEEMNAQGVVAAPDILNGTPADNKAIFDRMVRQLVAPTFNACVDAVEAVETAQQIINANEQVRNEAEVKRIEQENDRVTAENQRASAEDERKTAEAGRQQAETERAAAETKRANEENTRVNAENLRGNAETERNQAEESRILAENSREKAESKRATAEQARDSNETERSVAERKRAASEVDRALAENTRESNETDRASAEENRKSAEEQRDAAEKAREDNTAGIVAQATEQANKAQSSAEAAEEAKKAAEAAKDAASEIVGGNFASKTEAKGYAEQEVSAHNADIDSHNDIRLLIEGLATRLNALADSDDTTLDQMSEIVAYIKANKTLIDSITTNKVSVSDIINNLTTNVKNKPLSAAQGVTLKYLIDSLRNDLPPVVQEAGDSTANIMSQKAVTDLIEQKMQEIIESLAAPIIGTVDENNNIVLNGALAEGEYTLKYLAGEKYVEIGTLTISTEEIVPDTTLNWSAGTKIDSSTGAETTGSATYSASDYIAIVAGYTYTLTKNTTRSEACKVCYYDADKNFISTSADVIAQTINQTSATIPLIDGAAYFRVRLYGTAAQLADGDFTLTATKE